MYVFMQLMTKKEIVLLLSPSLIFAAIAIIAFFISHMVQQHTRDDDHRQKFEAFVENVQSGKWQLTTEKWLEGMRREDATAEDYRNASVSLAKIFQDFIWLSLAGIMFQAIAVISVLKRLRAMGNTVQNLQR
jgi:hypothetical protein